MEPESINTTTNMFHQKKKKQCFIHIRNTHFFVVIRRYLPDEQCRDRDASESGGEGLKAKQAKWLLRLLLWWPAIYIEQTFEHVVAVQVEAVGDSSTLMYLFV